MVYPQSNLEVFDNSGVKTVRCVQVVKKKYKHFGSVGSLFVGVVTSLKSKSQRRSSSIKKGSIIFGVVLATKKERPSNLCKTGFFMKSHINSCVLFQKKQFSKAQVMLGNRVQFYVSFLLKQKGFYKVYSVSDKYI